jgi:hypothetical protein
MDTSKFKSVAKKGMMTVAEVGVITGGALLTTKFLDFNTLFKDQIAKDPTFAQKWFVKYQAPIKLVAGATLAAYVKNPWAKLAFIGLAVNGAIGTVRLATAKADGTNFFQPMGNIDERLAEYARMNGAPITERFPTQVAGLPITERYPTQVGKPVDLMVYPYSSVGNNADMFRGIYGLNIGNQDLRGGQAFRGVNGLNIGVVSEGGCSCASNM